MTGTMKLFMMRKPAQLTLSFLVVSGVMAGLSSAALAQEANIAQPQQIFQDQQNRDPFSGRGSDQAGGVMDLVHRAMQAGSLSNEDFYDQQKENFDSATAGFREAQKQRLSGSQTSPSVGSSTVSPAK
jgi:hypothetical protein